MKLIPLLKSKISRIVILAIISTIFVISSVSILLVIINNKNNFQPSSKREQVQKKVDETKDWVYNADYEFENKEEGKEMIDTINVKVNGQTLQVKMESNTSSQALIEKLKHGSISIHATDYGNFEKVGELGFDLPTNDTQITTQPGDLILYQGNQITLYYDSNTWNFTRLGRVTNKTQEELKSILGSGDVTLILTIE